MSHYQQRNINRILDGRAQVGRLTASSGASQIVGDGLLSEFDITGGNPDPTFSLSMSTFGLLRQVRTRTAGATADDQAGIESDGAVQTMFNSSYMRVNGYAATTTNVRHYIGLMNTGSGFTAGVTADDPGVAHVGFQFSTPRADTTWQFTRRGSGSTIVVDTNVAVGNAGSFIIDAGDDDTAVVSLLNWDGTVAWTEFYDADLPTGSLDFTLGVETQTTASAGFWFRNALITIRRNMTDAP